MRDPGSQHKKTKKLLEMHGLCCKSVSRLNVPNRRWGQRCLVSCGSCLALYTVVQCIAQVLRISRSWMIAITSAEGLI